MRKRDFAYLQRKIDETISVMGSDGLISVLEMLAPDTLPKERVKMFIFHSVSNHYRISIHKLTEDGSKNNKDARMVLSYLIKQYLNYNVRQIAQACNRKSPNQTHTYLKDMQHFLDKPTLNPRLVSDFKTIDTKVSLFIDLIQNKIDKHGKQKKVPSLQE